MTQKETKNTEEKPLNLLQKLAAIRSSFGALEKDGQNTFHKYGYVTEAQVMQRLQELCDTFGVLIIPTCTGLSHEGDLTTVKMAYRFVDIDAPTDMPFEISFPGMGQDKGDKGIYKGMTGSYKYMAMKVFQLATGDDPENDSKDRPYSPPTPPTNRPPAYTQPPQQGRQTTGAHAFIYSTKGIQLSKSQFEAVRQAFKTAGYKFFGEKEGYDNTWRGEMDMGPKYARMLVTGTTRSDDELPESFNQTAPPAHTKQGEMFDDTDIPF